VNTLSSLSPSVIALTAALDFFLKAATDSTRIVRSKQGLDVETAIRVEYDALAQD
jgi:hypothetical protein